MRISRWWDARGCGRATGHRFSLARGGCQTTPDAGLWYSQWDLFQHGRDPAAPPSSRRTLR